jgi:O-antigen/teichoic acid export membrane protein
VESSAPASKSFAHAFARNAFFKAAGETVIRLLSFAFVVLVARALGGSQFGILNFANSFALLFVVVVDFGFNSLLVRDAAREPSRTAHVFYNLLAMKLLLGLLFVIAVLVGLQWVSPDPTMRRCTYWLALFILLNSFTEFFSSVFNSQQRMQYEAGIMAFQKLMLLGLGLGALALGWSSQGVAAAYAAAGLAGLLAAAVGLQHSRLLQGAWKWDPVFIRYALKQALPLTLTTLFINIYFRIDMTLLAKLRPASEVGWYAAAHKCVEVLMVVPAVLVVASFPGFSRLFVEDRPRLERAFLKVMKLLLLLGLPLAGGSLIVGSPLMAMIFGKEYAASGPALAWLCLALSFIFLNYPLSYLLISGERQKVNAVVSGVAVVVSVGTNLVLIPRFGYLGAAAAAAVTELFLFLAYFTAVNRLLFRLPGLGEAVARTLGATAIMMAAVWLARGLNPLLTVAVGGIAYVAAVWLVRAVQPEDMAIVKKMLKGGSRA